MVPGLTGAEIVVDGGDVPLPMVAAGVLLVLGHLVRNAVDHGARQVVFAAGTSGEVRVQDDGRGVSAGNRGRVFEPLFTTGRETGGTSMGLSIPRNILAAHGTGIVLDDRPGPTTFVIRFRVP